MGGGRVRPTDLPENVRKELSEVFKTIDVTRDLSLLESSGMRSAKDQVYHSSGKRKISPGHPVAFKVMARARRLASLRIYGSDCSDSLKNEFERQGFEYLAKLDDATNVVKMPQSVIFLLAEHDRACKKQRDKASISIIDDVGFLEETDPETYISS